MLQRYHSTKNTVNKGTAEDILNHLVIKWT